MPRMTIEIRLGTTSIDLLVPSYRTSPQRVVSSQDDSHPCLKSSKQEGEATANSSRS